MRRKKPSRPLHAFLHRLLQLPHLLDDGGSFGEMAQFHFGLHCPATLLRLVQFPEIASHSSNAILDATAKLWPETLQPRVKKK
jgi:hypothetical protein